MLSLQAPTVFAAGCSAPSDATLASCIANAGSGDTVTVTNSSISGTSNLGTLSAGATLIVGGNSAADTITAATLYMNGGTIRAAGDTTFSSSFDMADNTANTFAAAAGKSLLLSGPVYIHGNTTLTYGSTTDTGTVSLLLKGGTIARGAFVVAGGTLVGLNNNFAVVLGFVNSTTVDAGATLRDASNSPALTIRNLQGSGTVDSSGKPYQINAGNFSGMLIGTGGLTKGGATTDTLILSGANTYTGGTTITAGTVQVGNGGASGTLGTGAVIDDAILAFDRSDLVTVANAISGTGSVTQAGSGTTVLTGTNNYTGGTTVNAGALVAGSADAFTQNSAYTVNGGSLDLGSWDLTASSLSGTGGAVQLDAQSLVVNQASNTGYAGTITGSGSLVKGGAGSLSLTGPNTYSGITTINAGTLQVGDGGTTGTLGTGAVVDNAALVFNRSDLMTVANAISGSGDLMQAGSGTLNLTGANTYTGGTSINAGTLKVNNTSGSATGTGAVAVNSGGTLGGAGTVYGAVSINAGGTLAAGNSPGTLTTGALTLATGSTLAYELGQAGVPGGAFNDLVVVNGDLTLGGTLNVTESAGGRFGAGVYRLISYTGGLTDNGLAIGSAPAAASDLQVQTSVAQQINLINRAGVSLNFWDGSNGAQYNNNNVTGGSGSWRVGVPGDAWTDSDGHINAAWVQNQYAVFGGAAGTVAVDDTGGTVRIGGAQFMVDGYRVTGDALHIDTVGTVIRVGDGTAGGAAMTATIDSAITGTGGIVKDDLGMLVLNGANTYSGGTVVSSGVLQGNSTSLQGSIVNNANVTFEQTVNGTYSGVMGGSGLLRKTGGGELTLSSANTYQGGTRIDAGTIKANVSGALGTGPVNIAGNASLYFSGGADAGALNIAMAAGNGAVNGGFTQFSDNSSAGSATLVTQANANVSFADTSTAADAIIENHGGQITFWNNATGGQAKITNFGGATNLMGSSSAAQATITNETGGALDIYDTASANKATVVNKAGGVVRIRSLTAAGVSIGSLEGAGRVLLGTKALTVGELNTSTEISGVISDAGGSIIKEGTGTLTLSGANTYTGGTSLKQGQLNLGNNAALGTGALAMDDGTALGFSADGLTVANAIQLTGSNDPIIDTGTFSETLSGAITGGGFITKHGTGTLTLSGANTYTGATNVAQGTLKASAPNTFSAASAHAVASGATLDLAGFNQTVASLSNSGTVSLFGAMPGTTLTVNGNYVGNDGVLKLGTILSATGPSDRLVIDGGAASGKTRVQITNLGGLGARTTDNGIEVVTAQNGATTTAQTTKDAFSLAGGSVTAGAFEYRLYAADASGAGQNWYLRTDAAPAAGTSVPAYRLEAAMFAALPSQLRQSNLSMLGNLRLRVGDDDVKGATPTATGSDRRAWGRLITTDLDTQQGGTVSPTSKGNVSGFQAGTDLFANTNWRAGIYVGQLDGDAKVNGFASGIQNLRVGHNDLRNQYLGAYGTYTNDTGFYADAVVQAGRHRTNVTPLLSNSSDTMGNSLLASIEVGQALPIGNSGWIVEPQLQLIHQHIDLDTTQITGAIVQPEADGGWIARAGVRIKGQIDTSLGMLQPYGRVNVYESSNGTDVARFVTPAAMTDITAPVGGTSTELAGGFTLALSPRTTVYGEVGKLWSSGGSEKVRSAIGGSLGMRVKW